MGRVVHLLEQAPRRALFSSLKVCDQLYSVDRMYVFSDFSWDLGYLRGLCGAGSTYKGLRSPEMAAGCELGEPRESQTSLEICFQADKLRLWALIKGLGEKLVLLKSEDV